MASGSVGGRPLRNVVRAALSWRYSLGVLRVLVGSQHPLEFLYRYVTNRGEYPYRCVVRTAQSSLSMTLWHPHDVRTVNEIFFRRDYPASPIPRVVLDIGANIGISALFFLTRSQSVRVIAYEPNPQNLERLRLNLAPFADRVEVHDAAVTVGAGFYEFGIEPSGRYGSLLRPSGDKIEVEGRPIEVVLGEALKMYEAVDLIKVDTEGTERELIEAIPEALLHSVGSIYYEAGRGDDGAWALRQGFLVRSRVDVRVLTPSVSRDGRVGTDLGRET